MLYFERICISGGININKTIAPKECGILHYWYFLNYSFNFQQNVCNRGYNLLMMSINFSDIAVLNTRDADYHWIVSLIISKNEAINLI